jgi:hypothetical protein
MNYRKTTPRLSVKYIDANTEDVLFEVNDRNWMNVGELLTDHFVDSVVKKELDAVKTPYPRNLMVLVVGEYSLQ